MSPGYFLEYLFMGFKRGANYEGGGVCFHILMDRFGLCNPLSTKHIPSCDVSEFNLVHSQLCKDVWC